jgi:uncharacterized protein
MADDLIMASEAGDVAWLQSVLALGCDANTRLGKSRIHALVAAAGNNQLAAVEVLLAAGAVVNSADTYGRTALAHATGEGYASVARTLVAGGADVNAADSEGVTPLAGAATGGFWGIVRMLLPAGARTDVAAADGRRPVDVVRLQQTPKRGLGAAG